MSFWTPERTQILRELWIKGVPASQIAEIIGAPSRHTVGSKADRMRLPTRKGGPRRENYAAPAYGVSAEIDPRRADRRLRRFSWQAEE